MSDKPDNKKRCKQCNGNLNDNGECPGNCKAQAKKPIIDDR